MNQKLGPVLVAVLVLTVFVALNPGVFSGWSTMIGLIAFGLLCSTPPRVVTETWERAVLAMVWSLAGVLVLGRGVEKLLEWMGQRAVTASRVFFLLWLVASLLLYLAFRPNREEAK